MTTAATLEEVTDVGGVITDRQPVDFHRLGLAGCIDRLTAPLRHQGMCVHWETPHHGLEISASCASLLYRTAQEALSNTFRHAHATDVTVRLSAVFHGIRLTVADNGPGFEVPCSAPCPPRFRKPAGPSPSRLLPARALQSPSPFRWTELPLAGQRGALA